MGTVPLADKKTVYILYKNFEKRRVYSFTILMRIWIIT